MKLRSSGLATIGSSFLSFWWELAVTHTSLYMHRKLAREKKKNGQNGDVDDFYGKEELLKAHYNFGESSDKDHKGVPNRSPVIYAARTVSISEAIHGLDTNASEHGSLVLNNSYLSDVAFLEPSGEKDHL